MGFVIYLRFLIVMTILSFAITTSEQDVYSCEDPFDMNVIPGPGVHLQEVSDSLVKVDLDEEIDGEVIIGVLSYQGSDAPILIVTRLKDRILLGAEIRHGEGVDANSWYVIVKNRQDFELGVVTFVLIIQHPHCSNRFHIILNLINIDDNAPVVTGKTCQIPENTDNCVFEVTDADGSLSYDNMQISIVPRAGAAEDTIFDIDKQQESDGHITVRLTALVELDYDFVRLFIFTIAAHDSINEGRFTAVVQITPYSF